MECRRQQERGRGLLFWCMLGMAWLGLLFRAVIVKAEHNGPLDHWMKSDLVHFRVGGIGVFQPSGSLFSGIATYAPFWAIDTRFGLRLELSGSVLKNQTPAYFPVYTVQVLPTFHIQGSIWLELGGGVQTWVGNGGSFMLATAQIVFRPEDRVFRLFKEWGLAGSWIMIPNYSTYQGVVFVGF